MAQPQQKIQTKSQTAVQEYMDTMLTDLFPPIPDEAPVEAEPALKAVEAIPEQTVQTDTQFNVVTPETATEFMAAEPSEETEVQLETQLAEQIEQVTEQQAQTSLGELSAEPEITTEDVVEAPVGVHPVGEQLTTESVSQETVSEAEVETVVEPVVEVPAPEVEPQVENATATDTQVETLVETGSEREVGEIPAEIRYPNAPAWAQEDFDVLLFDVCGLKLAVSMESLGRIIKTEHETNNLIGRPDWFIGAYTEAEQSLFVVDTAKYIMPEKGFDLAEEGYDYIIQLQRTQWTLACKNVQTTVRLQPDQVKWRGEAGKRPWLAGTVVDHMCALIHVDSLIELLDSEVPG